MARPRTMALIIERGSRRADKEFDDHIEAEEWKALVSEVFGEIHSIVSGTGCRHFETEATITANGSSTYALPDDYQSTVGIDFVIDAVGRRQSLRGPLPVQRQFAYAGLTGDAYAFALGGQYIVLLPAPSSGTYKHRYIPQAADYSTAADDDEIDLVCADGEAFMYWSLKVLACDKGEDDLVLAERRRDAARDRLQKWAEDRVISESLERHVEEEDDTSIDPAEYR